MNKATFKKRQGHDNELLQGEGFYISYNPSPCDNIAGSFFSSDGGGAETALAVDSEGQKVWMILNGDYRKAYQAAFPDKEACIKVYKKHIEHRSSWSSDGETTEDLLNFLAKRTENIKER